MYKPFSVLIFAACMSACSAPEAVNISGSSTVLPAVSRAADLYTEQTQSVVVVNAGGSGSGFNQLAEGQTDIGMMSRDITPNEFEKFSALKFIQTPIGRDAVVPSISSEIYEAGVTALTLEQIADIYSGRVDNWSKFGGPDRPIFVIDKEASRGTRQIFMAIVLGNPKAQAAGADLVTGSNNEELTALTQSDSAIGMLSYAWLNDDVRGLSIITPKGDRIAPNLDTIRDGSFPFIRDLNVVTRSDISPAAQSFVDYLLGPQGQNAVEESGYIKVTE